ncbi:MAG: hypothetical protein LM577_08475 [Thermoproteaceae archaeon]|nr:hypothetical protein [Thermoproteaceae archaeon]
MSRWLILALGVALAILYAAAPAIVSLAGTRVTQGAAPQPPAREMPQPTAGQPGGERQGVTPAPAPPVGTTAAAERQPGSAPEAPAAGPGGQQAPAPPPPAGVPSQQGQAGRPPVRAGPRIEVAIDAPGLVNATELPASITYAVVLTNRGDEEGVALLSATPASSMRSIACNASESPAGAARAVRVPPNSTVIYRGVLTAAAAGDYEIRVEAQNATRAARVAVRYYAPRLAALPVTVNVTRLPSLVSATVTVLNLGNGTGRVAGVEVPPGGSATLRVALNVTAAGRYRARLDGLEVPVEVRYLAAACEARVDAPAEVEVVPGEAVRYAVRVRNAGNATAVCVVNGTALKLAPGEEGALEGSVKIGAAGRYAIVAAVNGTEHRAEVVARAVRVFVWYRMLSPAETPWRAPPCADTFYGDEPAVRVDYEWLVFTNATSRAVTVIINGEARRLAPGSSVTLMGSAAIERKGEISVDVNGTRYYAEVIVKPREPVVSISAAEMLFDCRVPRAVSTSCKGVEIRVEIARVKGAVRYGSVTAVSAEARLTWVSSAVDVRINATAAGGSGSGTGVVTYSEIAWLRPGTTISFKFQYSGGRITSVTEAYVNGVRVPGEYLECAAPLVAAIPAVLQPPPSGVTVREFAGTLVSMFARVDYVGEYTWDGYVEVGTPAGPVRVYASPPRAEGPLEVRFE